MEGETDREKGEERSSDDIVQASVAVEAATQPWKMVGSSVDEQALPIMHWEALSLRIAELEKQEEERREKAKCMGVPERGRGLGGWMEEKQQTLRREQRANEEDFEGCRVPVITSRFNSPKNLQLCFINNSESEEEEEDDDEGKAGKESSSEAEGRGSQSVGLKLEVRAALSALRDKLWAEEKEKERLTCSEGHTEVMRRKQLDRSDLQTCSLQQLDSLSASFNQNIQDLSSELVGHLLVRDHLRTKQDAMLLDVQDMT